MICDSGCQSCTEKGGNATIVNFAPPANAPPGSLVTLTFGAQIDWTKVIYSSFLACLYDLDTGQCVASGSFSLSWGDTSTTLSISYPQPANRDFHGNLSLSSSGVLYGYNCEDEVIFTVPTNFPPGTKWSCGKAGCYQDPSGEYPDNASCYAVCGAGGGGECYIGNPLGGCLLTKKGATNLAYVGLGVLALYVGYKVIQKYPSAPKRVYQSAKSGVESVKTTYRRAKEEFGKE